MNRQKKESVATALHVSKSASSTGRSSFMYSSTISMCVPDDNRSIGDAPSAMCVPDDDGSIGDTPSTPDTNRGVDDSHKSLGDVKFSIDWWRVTLWADRNYVMPLLSLLGLDVGLEDSGHAGLGFHRCENGLNGFQLYLDPVNPPKDGGTYVSLNFPSQCLDNLGLERVEQAATWLCEQGLSGLKWRSTRLDLAFDTQQFAAPAVEAAWDAGLVRTAAKKGKVEKGKGGDLGYTFYIGKRQSSAMLRTYHKMDGHSFGDEAFTRVELELKEDRALMGFLEIMAAPMIERPRVAARILAGFISIDTPWWAELMEGIESSWIKVKRPTPSVQRISKWVRNQVCPSFATLVIALSDGGDMDKMDDVMRELLNEGRISLKAKHHAMIEQYTADTAPVFVRGVA